MIITKVASFILHLPLPGGGAADSTNAITHWGVVGARVETDTGLVGWGYTGTHAHAASDRLIADCISKVHGPSLIGRDVAEHGQIWSDLANFAPVRWVGRGGITTLGLAAIDTALWDLKAKAADVPLWALLGGKAQDVVAYNTDVGWLSFDLDTLVENVKRTVDEGFRGVKLKVGQRDIINDVRRCEAVRKAIGPEIMLAVDGNGLWDLPTCKRFCKLAEHLDIFWFEEPLWYDDVNSHAELARSTSIPVALGEQLYSLDAFNNFVSAKAIHWLQPDVTRLGGVTEFLRVADLALANRLPVVAHAGDMGQVHRHLTIAHPAAPLTEHIPWIHMHFEDPAKIERGVFPCPTMPGASTTPTEEALSRYLIK